MKKLPYKSSYLTSTSSFTSVEDTVKLESEKWWSVEEFMLVVVSQNFQIWNEKRFVFKSWVQLEYVQIIRLLLYVGHVVLRIFDFVISSE